MRQLFPSGSGGIELFDEFFESGLEVSVSPFLIPKSRRWGVNLPLKASISAAFFLLAAYVFSFVSGFSALSNFFLLLTYFFAGIPALISSIEDLFDLDINIDVLMTLAAFLSVIIGSGKEGGLLLVLFSFSGSMEEAVRSKAKGAISALKKLSPQTAFVVEADGSLRPRSVRDIEIGTTIHVKAGEVVPLDGKVTEGISSVNLVHLTGENMPLTAKVGDTVPAGARNLEGALTLSITHTSSDSTLARIIQLVMQAQEAKPKLQRWLDRVSSTYAMTIISLAFIFALSFPFFLHIPFLGQEGSIYRSLAFLIAASPCALIIAIPIAYLSAVSACARTGILLKGGIILDTLAKCKTLAMDKTGTITTGELTLLEMNTYGDNPDPLALAYALERSAVHPIAHAVVRFAEEKKVKAAPLTEFMQVPGYGLKGTYQGLEAKIGNSDWILPSVPEKFRGSIVERTEKARKNGEMLTLLLWGESVTLLRFKDTLRPGIKQTLKELEQKCHMRLLMLTGDHEESARAIAGEAGIKEYFADLRPDDKLRMISQEEHLAMVGDGVNDAPALARAAVGISMGKVGSKSAIDASDIVLLQDNIELLSWLIQKAQQVVRIVRQNVTLATGAIIFASLPALFGWIPLWLAVILHEGGTVLVGLNGLRLLKKGRENGARTKDTSRKTQGGHPRGN